MPRAALAFLMTVATVLPAGHARSESPGTVAAGQPSLVEATAAAERGWFGVAREIVRQRGGATAEPDGFSARLERLEREADQAVLRRGREQAGRWAAGPYRAVWRRELVGAAAPGPPVSALGLVLWSTGAALHAARLEDGMPPWLPGSAGRDTRLFPRGNAAPPSGGLAATAPPASLCSVGGRAYAVLHHGAGEALVCLDLSPAAEGRLVWLVDIADVVAAGGGRPEGPLRCDGPPIADHELCCVVLRPAAARDALVLAAFAAADGRLAWTRRCGTALAADGSDRARGRRSPVFVEDRIVLATHAGAVIACARDGRPVWRTPTSAPIAVEAGSAPAAPRPQPSAAMPAALAAGGFVIAAPADSAEVTALEARSGAVAWRWAAEDAVVGLVGPVEDGVIAVTRSAEEATRLVRLDRASGREAARSHPLPGRSAGPVALVDNVLFQPRFRSGAVHGAGLVLDLYDPVSLASRPLSIDVALSETGEAGATPACFVAGGFGLLAVTVPAAIVCIEGAAGAANQRGASR